ncbi:hypothetical protein HOLleu_27636 [Holothuria leucospilota]|uniref:Uncharacterized protein n=1 Tax=Holothuria leucospilota TaxID=206669 RepID=A0A9Q1BR19_HOLLE|nr:hypothetical protein HOLleu_27636 [Holothuria leucospilota]
MIYTNFSPSLKTLITLCHDAIPLHLCRKASLLQGPNYSPVAMEAGIVILVCPTNRK